MTDDLETLQKLADELENQIAEQEAEMIYAVNTTTDRFEIAGLTIKWVSLKKQRSLVLRSILIARDIKAPEIKEPKYEPIRS